MLLKRCPSCRSLCDATKDAICFACGAALGDASLPGSVRTPEILRSAQRDRSRISALLILFAFFGGAGVVWTLVLPGIPIEFKVGLGVLLTGCLLLGLWSETRGSLRGSPQRIVLKGFAFFGILVMTAVAAVFGLLLLLIAACSFGALK